MAVNRAVSSHAGRVDFTRAGAPDSAIMRQGRWFSSTMVAKYTRGESAGDAPVARMNRPGRSHFGSAVPRSSARAAVHQTGQVLPARSGREIPGTKTDPATGPGLFRGSKVASSRGSGTSRSTRRESRGGRSLNIGPARIAQKRGPDDTEIATPSSSLRVASSRR